MEGGPHITELVECPGGFVTDGRKDIMGIDNVFMGTYNCAEK